MKEIVHWRFAYSLRFLINHLACLPSSRFWQIIEIKGKANIRNFGKLALMPKLALQTI